MAPPSPTAPNVNDELRQLFERGEYESVLNRADTLQKRKRLDAGQGRVYLDIVRAFSLIQLGRASEAVPLLSKHPLTSLPDTLVNAVTYAKLYTAWATNDAVEDAIVQVANLSGPDARALEAQLAYRSGQYGRASELFLAQYHAVKATLEEKKRPTSTSRWRLMSREPTAALVTAAELERYTSAVHEAATNTMAALVLANKPDEALALRGNLESSYELEYNAACAYIAQSMYTQADVSLQQAEALLRTELDDDEDEDEDGDEIVEAMAPIAVQRAYLQHLAGNVAEAKLTYEDIVTGGKADAASLAVAANNLTVALGQLAFGRAAPTQGERSMLPKEQHEALVEGLKKMRATSGKAVERKLTTSQKSAMGHNRAILLVQMGRTDACRTELAKLKSDFPRDPVVPLIEASLIARQSDLETADKVLRLAGDDDIVRAARVQLAVSHGDKRSAASLLQELFNGRPAAIVTAASLLEQIGETDEALSLSRSLASNCTARQQVGAKKVLAEMLLRMKKYEEAASVLRDVVKTDNNDSSAIAQLVIATSYFDAAEAEVAAARLMPMVYSKDVDAQMLESLPPPKRKQVAALKGNEKEVDSNSKESDAAAIAAKVRERKKSKRKKRLPKNYDPDGPPPDPERWLPKTLRSGYKKKKKKTDNFKGSQGADAAAADEAAAKNAERSLAKAAAAANDVPTVPGGRARAQRKKKGNRR